MQSLNNQSNIPLRANAIYIGSWDDILKYQNVQINLNADTNCEITYYTSNDKVFIENQTFAYNANDNYYNSINSTSRYVYFTVRNLENVNQTQFNFSVLYKDYPVSSGGVNSNVNIVSPLTGGAVDIAGTVSVSNFPATQPVSIAGSVAVTNTDITNIYNIVNSKTSGSLWNANVTGINGVSTSVDLSTKNIKNLTFMGNCNGATILTVQFSNDGSNWYDSQYAYTLSASGDVGFNIPCCPNYVRLKSSASVTATMLLNSC